MRLLLQLLTVFVMAVSLQGWLPLGCLEEERTALLQLKGALNYPNGTSLPFWRKGDAHCCSWERVECSSSTGRVTMLHLGSVRNQELGDWSLNASLFLPFQQLNTLNLSDNRIAGLVEKKGTHEPRRLSNLEHLNLGLNHFNNSILSVMKGFSSLKSLYLGYNKLEGLIDLKESLSSLEDLDLSGNKINKLVASRGLSNLSVLRLENITTYASSFQLLQLLEAFPNLTTLYLSYNDFRGRISELQNLSSLEKLYLDCCFLDNNIIQSLGVLPFLKHLSLRALSNIVPSRGFFYLKNLKYLDLSYNTLNNSIFQAIGTMTSLKTLRLQSCELDGRMPIAQGFLNLKNLKLLDLSSNTLDNTIFQTIGWLPPDCLEEERIVLLQLKDAFNYPNGTSLPSWRKGDAHCCSWERVECSNSTGRVTMLDLGSVRNQELGDWYLNASLFLPFQQLNTLNLSDNRIAGLVGKKGTHEPRRLSNLEHLNLGSNHFNNSILSFVKGFSFLKSLYLGYNKLEGLMDLKESLSSLEDLDLSGNKINKLIASRGPSNLSALRLENITTYESSFQLLQSLGAFPNITTLYLSYNDFRGRISELQNLSSLEELYLDYCFLDNNIIQSLGALPSLKYLSLQALSSIVPSEGFLNLKNLELLDLSSNTLNNTIFQTIGLCDLNHLQVLYMHGNDLSGFLPPCLANLTSLQQLDLSDNHLKIPISLSPLYNLSKLKSFDGSSNEIYTKEDDHNLSPKFQLEYLSLSGRGQGAGAFPKFLYHQINLQYVDLTNIQIKGEFLNWLIDNNTYLQDLYLENCSLSGPFLLPKNSHMNLSFLSISMNYFQGQIPSEIGAYLPRLEVLLMSDNGFHGSIPSSLGNINSLQVLDLSNNSLQGQIPGWIGNMSSLEFLDLSGNNFFGPLPSRFGTSSKLRYVYLSRNKLQGPIAMAFYDSSEIFALDLSRNNLTGIIPEWIDSYLT